MNEQNYMRVIACSSPVQAASLKANSDAIISSFMEASEQGADIVLFPELAITGYTCADLFLQSSLIEEAEKQAGRIIMECSARNSLIVFGMPVAHNGTLYNAAVVVRGGREILGVVPKTYIPEGREFYEKRWFASAEGINFNQIKLAEQLVPFGTDLIFQYENNHKASFAIEICEDLWAPIPPSSRHCLAGAQIILNLSASNKTAGKADYRRALVTQQSARTLAAYAYTSSGSGESTTDTVYSGHSLIAENGIILAESPDKTSKTREFTSADIDLDLLNHERLISPSFQNACHIEINKKNYQYITFSGKLGKNITLARSIPPHPFIPAQESERQKRCEEIFAIQSTALATRLHNIRIENVVIGISGGLDSTLALMVITEAFKHLSLPFNGIHALNMPGFGSTDRTRENARKLCSSLNISLEIIDIGEACTLQMKNLKHPPENHNTTYQNIQARQRTMLLMNMSNSRNALVIGTGDLSELALGWCTYNGDHMSMYAVNSGVPKTLVRYLVQWFQDTKADSQLEKTLADILRTPASPELLPPSADGKILQKTESQIGPYELHDFFLFYSIRYGFSPRKVLFLAEKAFDKSFPRKEILHWMRIFYTRFFASQFKRSCMPDGPKIGSIALSPRADWRMPSDANALLWLEQIDELH